MKLSRKQRKMLIRICIAAALLVIVNIIRLSGLVVGNGTFGFVFYLSLYVATYLVIGYDILLKAGKGIINLRPFDECFLMAFATVGAFALAVIERSGDYNEAIAVMLFYQIGELFQSYAVGRSRRNISDLMDIRPDYANIEKDGELEQVDPDSVEIGTIIVVKPGEKVPIDGVVVEGSSSLNTAALTGESVPRDVVSGDEIISGCINLTGVLRIRTTKAFGESTVSKILELVENASSREIPIRGIHSKVRQSLYSCGRVQRRCTGCYSFDLHRCMVGLGLQGPYIPGNQLPVRTCCEHSAQLFCRHRRCKP